jgi:hypothetical protein
MMLKIASMNNKEWKIVNVIVILTLISRVKYIKKMGNLIQEE